MAISCAGTLSVSPEGAPLCSGDWVMEPSQLDQLYQLLNSVFSTPDTVSISAAFMSGCTIPLIGFLASWGYQTVISFINHQEES